jgi:hypothetical protein
VTSIVDDPEVATVALATLTKMVSLLAAELVVGAHNDSIDLLETAIRAKLFAAVEGVSPEATAAGVALAHRLVEPVLRDLRTRAEARNAQVAAQANSRKREREKKPSTRKLN